MRRLGQGFGSDDALALTLPWASGLCVLGKIKKGDHRNYSTIAVLVFVYYT